MMCWNTLKWKIYTGILMYLGVSSFSVKVPQMAERNKKILKSYILMVQYIFYVNVILKGLPCDLSP